MTKAAPQVDPSREFEKLIRSFDARQPWRVFSDFCEMGALTMSNRVVVNPERERRYMEIMKGYTEKERVAFPSLFACVVRALVEKNGEVDFLGDVFQSLELANHWKGQFFSPFPICRLMAELTFGGAEDIVREKGFITAHEPACGAGGMFLALAAVLRGKDIDPSRHMWVSAVDIDPTAAHMAFIQLSLVGIPAEVVIGDTLRMQFSETFLTPYHYLGLWDARLRAARALDALKAAETVVVPEVTPEPEPDPAETMLRQKAGRQQLRLFGG